MLIYIIYRIQHCRSAVETMVSPLVTVSPMVDGPSNRCHPGIPRDLRDYQHGWFHLELLMAGWTWLGHTGTLGKCFKKRYKKKKKHRKNGQKEAERLINIGHVDHKWWQILCRKSYHHYVTMRIKLTTTITAWICVTIILLVSSWANWGTQDPDRCAIRSTWKTPTPTANVTKLYYKNV